jgi:UDP-3-O-[3-hydroxymyristoyl] glucosamine N-acyltransferase
MSGPFFLPRAAQTSIGEIAACTGAAVVESPQLPAIITGAALIDEAGPGDLTFLDFPEDAACLETCRAAACFVTHFHAALLPKATLALVVENPYRAFLLALCKLFPQALRPGSMLASAGINPGAFVHPGARLELGVIVDPGAIIGPHAEVGSGTVIGANSVIGTSVRIGRECLIGPQVTVSHALIGDRVSLHPGVRIGQPSVNAGGPGCGPAELPAVPRLGRVIIQDGVEIGANSTVDRGILGDTVIGEGTRIGDLARIAENAMTGRYCAIAAHSEIPAGARVDDDFAAMAGAAGCTAAARAV